MSYVEDPKEWTDRHAVIVALNTAILWEESLADANTLPSYYPASADLDETKARCLAKIERYKRLLRHRYKAR